MSYPRVGGYVLVDGSGIDETAITEGEQTISGIFARFHAALLTHKPVIVENVVNGEQEYQPFDVTIHGDDLVINVALGTIVVSISADDKVTKIDNG